MRPTLETPLIHLRDALAWRIRDLLGDQRVDRSIERIARHWRRSLKKAVFFGIAGSAGKTTTKELLLGILNQKNRGIGNPGSLNRPTEVATTILRARPKHDFCVVELSEARPADMDEGLALLQPAIGIVTVVGDDHWSAYRSRSAIADEMGKLVESLPVTGTAVLNADDELVFAMVPKCVARVITYGTSPTADLRAMDIDASWPQPLRFTLARGNERADVRTKLYGSHWIPSVLGAIGGGLALGLTLDECVAGIANVEPFDGRMQSVTTGAGVTFIRDDWKAPLWTVDGCFDFMKSARAKRKILVIGTLSDCGAGAPEKYIKVARRAQAVADITIFVGPWASQVLKARRPEAAEALHIFRNVRDAAEYLKSNTRDGDLVLLKGTNKQDHLFRIIMARTDSIACWRDNCERHTLCNECSDRNKPSGLPALIASASAIQTSADAPRSARAALAPDEQVIIGLGNPESIYNGTPHNIGYEVVESLADSLGLSWECAPHAWIARGKADGRPVCLIKLRVAMNLTGAALKALSEDMEFTPERCILVQDDLDLSLGSVRTRLSGGGGGHRGVISILEAFQTDAFRRVKIGVGQAGAKVNRVEYVYPRSTRRAVRPLIRQSLPRDSARSNWWSDSVLRNKRSELKPVARADGSGSTRSTLGTTVIRVRDALAWRVRNVLGDKLVDRIVDTTIEGIARRWRPIIRKPVYIGVTGSVGKTTTKELLLGMLSHKGRGVGNYGSYSTMFGITRALLHLRPWHSFFVTELSGHNPNEMDRPLALVRPSIGIVTVIGDDHSSAAYPREAIAREKSKLVAALPATGTAVLNADDALVLAMAERCAGKVITFGLSARAELRAEDVSSVWPERLQMTLVHRGERVLLRTQLCGTHWIPSVLGAIGAGLAMGMSLQECADGIARIAPFDGRMQPVTTPEGVTFIRDDFKAPLWTVGPSFEFMEAARAARKVIVIGELSDAGSDKGAKYARTARLAQEIADVTVFVGPWASAALKARQPGKVLHAFGHVREAAEYINTNTRAGDLVLLKGTNRRDHLIRIILARSGDVACWQDDCNRYTLCNECPYRNRPSAPPMATGGASGFGAAPQVTKSKLHALQPDEQVIVGLGNPESRYAGTPHNVGYDVVDRIAATLGLAWDESPLAWIARGSIDERHVCLMKVRSAMNGTGTVLKELAETMSFSHAQCVLVHDDLAIPIGTIRTRLRGSAGGHLGVASILLAFQTDAFRRVKVGIGQPGANRDRLDYVLSTFDASTRPAVELAVAAAEARVIAMVAEVPAKAR